VRTQHGHIFDLLADPTQPLVTGDGLPLKTVTGALKARSKRGKRAAR
jgi:hypothetical protein